MKRKNQLITLLMVIALIAANIAWVSAEPGERGKENSSERAREVLEEVKPFQDPNPVVGPKKIGLKLP